jgi:hypothetical protein
MGSLDCGLYLLGGNIKNEEKCKSSRAIAFFQLSNFFRIDWDLNPKIHENGIIIILQIVLFLFKKLSQ